MVSRTALTLHCYPFSQNGICCSVGDLSPPEEEPLSCDAETELPPDRRNIDIVLFREVISAQSACCAGWTPLQHILVSPPRSSPKSGHGYAEGPCPRDIAQFQLLTRERQIKGFSKACAGRAGMLCFRSVGVGAAGQEGA